MEYTEKKGFFKSLIGTKAFYASVIAILIPMMVQQGITNFVNLLDNVMVGQLGTESMSAVAIVNQIIFVFNLTVFGGVSGASIFGAQFYGKGDTEGLRNTFRYKIWLSLIVGIGGILVFVFWGENLVSLFLNEVEGDSGNLALTLSLAKDYLRISLWGLLPFAFVQCFGSTLKDTGETFAPMMASVIAISLNLVLNFILIFGKLGFPAMGVTGAAIATVISRYVELVYIVVATYRKKYKFKFIVGAFKTLRVPFSLVKKITITGTPLLLNETLWAVATAMIAQAYSVRGLNAVAATNINNTIWGVFAIVMFALGNAVGIIVGQQLGANDIDVAKDTVRKLLFFSVIINLAIGLIIIATSPFIPLIYNTSNEVRQTATVLLMISGAAMPFDAYTNVTYFTMRSGGKTGITFIFDCVFQWAITLPIAYFLSTYTTLSLPLIFLCVHASNLIKIAVGTIMIKSGIWAKNVVNDESLKA